MRSSKKWHAVAADRVAPDLQQQSLDGVGIKFLRRQANNLTQRAADRERFAIRPLAGHGVERVGQADDAHRHGDIFHHQPVRISRAIAAFVMRTHDLRNTRPGKLHAADDLMSDHGVVSHFAKFFGIQRRGLSEQTFVHRNFADVVQIASGAQSRRRRWAPCPWPLRWRRHSAPPAASGREC